MTESEIVLPPGYTERLADLKSIVAAAPWHARRVINSRRPQ